MLPLWIQFMVKIELFVPAEYTGGPDGNDNELIVCWAAGCHGPDYQTNNSILLTPVKQYGVVIRAEF
jgi:hypothetical protein